MESTSTLTVIDSDQAHVCCRHQEELTVVLRRLAELEEWVEELSGDVADHLAGVA